MTSKRTAETPGVRPPGKQRPRRIDLDGLRVLLCGSIILAHALLIFGNEPHYHLKSDILSPVASVLYEFLHATTMPLFFVLAGWSALTSLRRRTVGRFMQERATRLLPPLIIGTFLMGSIIKYIELSHGRDMGLHGLRMVEPLQVAFFDFFPRNLKHAKLQTWSHLWFLAYLFLISLLSLPLLQRLARCAASFVVPGRSMAYLPAIPLAVLLAAGNGWWPFVPNVITDWTNFTYFAVCFLIGAGLAAWPGFEIRLRTEATRLLLLMLLAFAGVVVCGETTAGRLFVGLTAWAAIGAGLGFAARLKPAASPALDYLSEATLPIYIVHHLPLLLLGAAVLPLDVPVWLKIVLICAGAGVTSLAAYHWLIRPWPHMRRLMGMVAVPSTPAPAAPKRLPSI